MTLYRPFSTPLAASSAADGQPLPSNPGVTHGSEGSSGATPPGGAATPHAGYAAAAEELTAAYPAFPTPPRVGIRGVKVFPCNDLIPHLSTVGRVTR
jgi:hypothetical protein